ncbi:DUF3613 domain-containing protein [Methylotenera versatilis]|uniref:DUF3613 domain-containing protein n=1 Tax=Methylotenera versatilis TaxID=1055487 RepID=UPI00068CFB5D|nr:DUF3613 domain-containing protein [Methylotenera versatilis]
MNKKLAIAMSILLAMAFQQAIQAEELESGNQVAADSSSNNTKLLDANSEPATQTWLELQRSGNQASPHAQTLSGPVMQNVYERYKESFSRPIPQMTEQDARKIK